MYLVFSELNNISCEKSYSSQTFNIEFNALQDGAMTSDFVGIDKSASEQTVHMTTDGKLA